MLRAVAFCARTCVKFKPSGTVAIHEGNQSFTCVASYVHITYIRTSKFSPVAKITATLIVQSYY